MYHSAHCLAKVHSQSHRNRPAKAYRVRNRLADRHVMEPILAVAGTGNEREMADWTQEPPAAVRVKGRDPLRCFGGIVASDDLTILLFVAGVYDRIGCFAK